MRRLLAGSGAAAAAMFLTAAPALACGGLVAPDGDVHLDKATTLVAWHGGVEHYVTSFAYTGSATDVGWIVPLPAVPTAIQAAGRWTLQRLEQEFSPPALERLPANGGAAGGAGSIVVEQVQVEALSITVLKGSGDAVIDWCAHNGFLLPPDTRDHLLVYAHATQVFMAAKYNASTAQQRGLRSGDGVPLLITMRTPQLWVPLEVLADDDTFVNADLFLMTDAQLRTVNANPLFTFLSSDDVDGASGFRLVRQERMSEQLHADLASDRNMSWLPATGWISYLQLGAPSSQVTYDLGVGGDSVIRLAAFGTTPPRVVQERTAAETWAPASAAAASALLLILAGYVVWRRSRFSMSTGSTSSAGSNPSTLPKK